MTHAGQPRFRRVWGYVRLALLVILTLLLIIALATQGLGHDAALTAVFIALLAFLEAMDRGWLRRFGGGGPPDTR